MLGKKIIVTFPSERVWPVAYVIVLRARPVCGGWTIAMNDYFSSEPFDLVTDSDEEMTDPMEEDLDNYLSPEAAEAEVDEKLEAMDRKYPYVAGLVAHVLEFGNEREVEHFLEKVIVPGAGLDMNHLPPFAVPYNVHYEVRTNPATGETLGVEATNLDVLRDQDRPPFFDNNVLVALLDNIQIVPPTGTTVEQVEGLALMRRFLDILVHDKGAAWNFEAFEFRDPINALLNGTMGVGGVYDDWSDHDRALVGNAWKPLWTTLLQPLGEQWLMTKIDVPGVSDDDRLYRVYRIASLFVHDLHEDWVFESDKPGQQSLAQIVFSYRSIGRDKEVLRDIDAILNSDHKDVQDHRTRLKNLLDTTTPLLSSQRRPPAEARAPFRRWRPSFLPARQRAAQIRELRAGAPPQEEFTLNQYRLAFTARHLSPDAFLYRSEFINDAGGYVEGFLLPNISPVQYHSLQFSTPFIEAALNTARFADEDGPMAYLLRSLSENEDVYVTGGVDDPLRARDYGAFQHFIATLLAQIERDRERRLFDVPVETARAFLELSQFSGRTVRIPHKNVQIHVWMVVLLLADVEPAFRAVLAERAPHIFGYHPDQMPDEVTVFIEWYQSLFQGADAHIANLMRVRYALIYGEVVVARTRADMHRRNIRAAPAAPAAARASG